MLVQCIAIAELPLAYKFTPRALHLAHLIFIQASLTTTDRQGHFTYAADSSCDAQHELSPWTVSTGLSESSPSRTARGNQDAGSLASFGGRSNDFRTPDGPRVLKLTFPLHIYRWRLKARVRTYR